LAEEAEQGTEDPDRKPPCVPTSMSSEGRAAEQVDAILEPFAPNVRQEIIEQTMFHQGPLPPAELLRQYDLVAPGLAREIADGAVEERGFRHEMTRRANK
jgi:uncharacterized membrane protein